MTKELKFIPTEIQTFILKDKNDVSNYVHVSIEEMDYMMQCAMKYQQLHEAWFKGVENDDPTLFFLRKCKEVMENIQVPTRTKMT